MFSFAEASNQTGYDEDSPKVILAIEYTRRFTILSFIPRAIADTMDRISMSSGDQIMRSKFSMSDLPLSLGSVICQDLLVRSLNSFVVAHLTGYFYRSKSE